MKLEVLHLDTACVVVNKPTGVCVIPDRQGNKQTVRTLLEEQLQQKLWVLHRLDRETSGALLFAKNAQAHQILNDAFAARQISKTYWALTTGSLADTGIFAGALHKARKNRMRLAKPGEDGLAAQTRFKVLERLGNAMWLELSPHTGRQHQLRVHLSSAGCAIFGDPLYAPNEIRQATPQLMLHARSLTFVSPGSGAQTTAVAEPPAFFMSTLEKLRANKT